jgi:hypothetical protein
MGSIINAKRGNCATWVDDSLASFLANVICKIVSSSLDVLCECSFLLSLCYILVLYICVYSVSLHSLPVLCLLLWYNCVNIFPVLSACSMSCLCYFFCAASIPLPFLFNASLSLIFKPLLCPCSCYTLSLSLRYMPLLCPCFCGVYTEPCPLFAYAVSLAFRAFAVFLLCLYSVPVLSASAKSLSLIFMS